MSFPGPSVNVPTFTQYPSLYYQGITFGPAPFRIRSDQNGINGLDMPAVRTGDAQAPRMHGDYIGLDTLDTRTITVTLDIGPPFGSYGTLSGAMAALRTALTPTGTTENPLFLQLPGGPMLVTLVRPRKRATQIDLAYVVGSLAQNVPIQFVATDPALYAAGTLATSVTAPAPGLGFGFPLTFPISFGGGTEVGLLSATNYGDLPCYPAIVFTGPCTFPTITNDSIVGNPTIQFQQVMAGGDTLVVNTDPKYRSALYYASGNSQGSPRLYTLSQGSQWWALPPNSTSQITFTTLDVKQVTGSALLEYTSAYSAVA